MRNFGRALRDALRYWPSVLAATLCSLAIATLWGANIGACYPILELTLKEQSISSWLADERANSSQRLESLNSEIAVLKQDAELQQSTRLKNRLATLEQNAGIERGTLQRIDKYKPWIDAHLPTKPFQTVALIVGVVMVSTLFKHFFMMANEILVARVAMDISRSLRQKIFERALRLDRATFSQYGTSGISAHIMQTSEMLSNALMNMLGSAVREPLRIIACLIGAGLICWRLLLLSTIVTPIVGGLLYWLTRRLRSISRGVLSRSASFYEVMLESLGNIHTTQAYTMEQYEQARFAQATKELRRNGLKFIFYTSLTRPVIELLGLGMMCTAIIGGAYLVLNQETHLLGLPICNQPLTVSALLVFFGMLVGASDPLRKLAASYSAIYAGAIAADAIYPLLDKQSKISDPEIPVEPMGRHQMLSLNNVTFGYRPDQALLENVSLSIPFGSTIAIVGHNGCGKSTLINLLCRFYDPNQGSLTLDGIDLRSMRIESLRKRIALVTQQSELFNKSVAYNIRYGSMDATDAQVVDAAKQAHAHEFVSSVLDAGYESSVGQNGQKLSGGQRQRIALARALLRDPEILILDEATSQIDMQSEQLIRESLALHRGKRTMIIITHREALLELADKIYEVRDGKLHPQSRKRAAA